MNPVLLVFFLLTSPRVEAIPSAAPTQTVPGNGQPDGKKDGDPSKEDDIGPCEPDPKPCDKQDKKCQEGAEAPKGKPGGKNRCTRSTSTSGGTGQPRGKAPQDPGVTQETSAALTKHTGVATTDATRIAAALNLKKNSEAMGGGAGTPAVGGTSNPGSLAAVDLEKIRKTPASDSSYLGTLDTHAPPKIRPKLPIEPPKPTAMESIANWVDSHVDPKTQAQITDSVAGFGDGMSFGLSKWVRKKMGTDHVVNTDSLQYSGGQATAALYSLAMGGAGIFKPVGVGVQNVARWAPALAEDGSVILKEGQFVMAGAGGRIANAINWVKAGGPELAVKYGADYLKSPATFKVAANMLRYPIQEEGVIMGTLKGWIGQRIYTGATLVAP